VNIFEAAVHGNMLGIIFFSLLFGFALSKIDSDAATTVSNVVKGVFNTLMKMTHFFMRAMPLGVFFLVAKATAVQGSESFVALLSFFGTVVLSLITFMLVILPILLRLMGLSPLRHLQAMAPALVTAFSTSSSTATLPITMDCVEKRAGVSNKICSFVVPLGTSVNMSGSALYECVAAFFIAQVYGIELSFVHQALIVFLSLITSMGIAGIPSGSLVSIMIVLNSMGIPIEGLALILPVDRILDMCRTTVNVFSDTSCAVLVAHSEGEKVLKRI
jgi:proton glutamate symport protein